MAAVILALEFAAHGVAGKAHRHLRDTTINGALTSAEAGNTVRTAGTVTVTIGAAVTGAGRGIGDEVGAAVERAGIADTVTGAVAPHPAGVAG